MTNTKYLYIYNNIKTNLEGSLMNIYVSYTSQLQTKIDEIHSELSHFRFFQEQYTDILNSNVLEFKCILDTAVDAEQMKCIYSQAIEFFDDLLQEFLFQKAEIELCLKEIDALDVKIQDHHRSKLNQCFSRYYNYRMRNTNKAYLHSNFQNDVLGIVKCIKNIKSLRWEGILFYLRIVALLRLMRWV